MLPPHFRSGRNRRQLRRPPSPLQDHGQPAEDTTPTVLAHFPRRPQDVYAAVEVLRQASGHRLTDELLKPILYHADYDCVHFKVASSRESSRHSSGSETLPEPYFETDALMWLGDFDIAKEDGTAVQRFNGRVRSIRIEATSRDQGWVQNPNDGCWSWLELGKREADHAQRQRKHWKQNSLGDMSWTHHSSFYHLDEDTSTMDPGLSVWLDTLQNGDRLSLIPMARFQGWSCNVAKGMIDIEIELWR